jgi:hypothetical protein
MPLCKRTAVLCAGNPNLTSALIVIAVKHFLRTFCSLKRDLILFHGIHFMYCTPFARTTYINCDHHNQNVCHHNFA